MSLPDRIAPSSSADRRRQQVHPYLRRDVYQRLKAYCARRGVTDTAVIETALRQYLDQSSDPTLIIRRLDRTGRAVDRVRREIDVLSEFVSTWVRVWFAHTPPLPEAARDGAQRSAAKRYEQMLDFVAKRLAGRPRLATDLIGDDPADQEELAAVARRASDGTEPTNE
jgi:hypothetical protein